MTFAEREKKAHEIVSGMSDEEKVRFLQGVDFWHLHSDEAHGVPPVFLSDGPSGLRKQAAQGDHLGLLKSHPAVCYPSSSTAACSFDEALLEKLGVSLASECVRQEVDMILGPGMNHQRNPMCGRNFEYYSEDPYLTGVLASAVVRGIQSQGIASCIKHFAANSQESLRFVADSIVDERALHEIYLRAFELVVRRSQPEAIMTAYNKLNGAYCTESDFLMQKTARNKWGFKGLFVSDWGAINDEVKSFASGLDLEMPGVCKGTAQIVLEAVKQNQIEKSRVDEAAEHMVSFSLLHEEKKECALSEEESLLLSQKISEQSAVLLKNEGKILPLSSEKKIAVIGRFAKHVRYQGAGSSKVNPVTLVNPLESLDSRGIPYEYAQGFHEDGRTSRAFLKDAKKLAAKSDVVLVFAGLPGQFESEGADRNTLSMPIGINRLIHEVVSVNENCVLVLHSGSPVLIPSLSKIKSVLYMGLGGGMVGEATVRLLFGEVNPSGCLAQTWPLHTADIPSYPWYRKNHRVCEYRESIYTGYRWYDETGILPMFRFGHGLSYTSFDISSISLSSQNIREGESLKVSFAVKNTGSRSGSSVIKAYVSNKNPSVFSCKKELKAFTKVFLCEGESREVSLELPYDSFSYYSIKAGGYAVQGGDWGIELVALSDTYFGSRLETQVCVEQSKNYVDESDFYSKLPTYASPQKLHEVSKEEFEILLGTKVPENPKAGKPFGKNTTMQDLVKTTFLFKIAKPIIMHMAGGYDEGSKWEKKNTGRSVLEMPLRAIGMMGGITKDGVNRIIRKLNRWLF